MAHFAELDSSNTVLRVVVIGDADCLDDHGKESEAVGIAFCQSLFGGRWIQTSYSGRRRGQFAAIGDIYDPESDVFRSPVELEPERARDEQGRFIADDPTTPENEAWVQP